MKPAASSAHGRSGSVVIFNFFRGVFDRGIPLYVENLVAAFHRSGIRCVQVTCPRAFRRLPRPLLNFLFVVYEQLVLPLLSLRFSCAIYPYNSVSVLSAVLGRPAMVVHDFIPLSPRDRKFAARYIRFTQRIHALFGRDIIFIARRSREVARRARLYPRSRTFLFPNSFFLFQQSLSPAPAPPGEHVLLCSGWGRNKDLPGALDLYLRSGLYRSRPLRILGIAGHDEAVTAFLSAHPGLAGSITVLPRLSDAGVATAYRSAAWVWVHSAKEGYGRSIAEAKLCACRIVASDIPPFRDQRDGFVFLYAGLAAFVQACALCESSAAQPPARQPAEHQQLLAEIERFCLAHRLRPHSKPESESPQYPRLTQ